jgi:hypothetical protein
VPLRLSEAQKRSLIRAMVEQQIGDLSNCQLFTGAAEYEVGTFNRYARLETAPAPLAEALSAGPDFSALGTAADQLLGTLDKAPDVPVANEEGAENPWTLVRSRRLRCELHRLVRACHQPVPPPKPTPKPAVTGEPLVDAGSTRRFVRSLARTFGECFDQPATLDPGSPFRRALELITTATGIRLGALDTPALAGPQGLG